MKNNGRVPLGEVADFINGVAFKPDDWRDEGQRIIRIQNLTDTSKPYNRTTRVVDEKYHVHFGDLLVSWSATLGVFVWDQPDVALVNQHIFRVVPKADRVHAGYLRQMLIDALIEMERHLHGATMKHVNRKEFLATTIPLPPLAEQKRIAGILDAADALRAKRRASLAQLDTLLQSTFLDLFGDPVTNPMGWEVVTGKDVFEDLTYGTSTKSLDYPGPGCVPVLRIPNIIGGQINRSDLKFSEPTEKEVKKLALRGDDLLFVRTNGNPDYIGRCARYEDTPNKTCLFASYLIRGRIASAVSVQAEYLKHHVEFPSYRHEVRREARTTAGNFNLSTAGIRKFKFIAPPLDLQRRFAAIVESVERQKARLRAHLAELDTLFASLQARAFTGEL